MMLAPLCPDCIHLPPLGVEGAGDHAGHHCHVLGVKERDSGAVVHAEVCGLVDDDAPHGDAEALA